MHCKLISDQILYVWKVKIYLRYLCIQVLDSLVSVYSYGIYKMYLSCSIYLNCTGPKLHDYMVRVL